MFLKMIKIWNSFNQRRKEVLMYFEKAIFISKFQIFESFDFSLFSKKLCSFSVYNHIPFVEYICHLNHGWIHLCRSIPFHTWNEHEYRFHQLLVRKHFHIVSHRKCNFQFSCCIDFLEDITVSINYI